MTRVRFVLLLVAALAAMIYVLLPPKPRQLSTDALLNAPVVRGAFHVHTRRSDGSGTIEQVAAAAGRARLSFVIITDHGDAARAPEPPAYLDGVLVIDAVEVSTDGGHVIALGMPVAPYPLAGEARDVVEDIARLGGISIAAHPDSPKPSLRWTDWTSPFDGIEWLNADSEWRDESAGRLARALFTYPFRRPETLATLLDRQDDAIKQWDVLLARRPVVALAAGDAHARIGLSGEPDAGRFALHLPAYEQMFRTFSIAIPRLALSGDAAADAEAIVTSVLEGNVFSSIDAMAAPSVLGFTGTSSGIRVGIGGRLPVGKPVHFNVETNAPADARVRLLKDGKVVTEVGGPTLRYTAPDGPGVYRVEVSMPGAPGNPAVPWILSNPIYVRPSAAGTPAVRPAATQTATLYADGPSTGWAVEASVRAKGTLDATGTTEGTELSLRYALGGSRADAPFVALTMPAGPVASYDRLTFSARALRPMRVSVELRIADSADGQRWHRSVYLDETPRTVTVFFDELTPRGAASGQGLDLSAVDTVLFVVDTVNAHPGSNGQFWLDDVVYGR